MKAGIQYKLAALFAGLAAILGVAVVASLLFDEYGDDFYSYAELKRPEPAAASNKVLETAKKGSRELFSIPDEDAPAKDQASTDDKKLADSKKASDDTLPQESKADAKLNEQSDETAKSDDPKESKPSSEERAKTEKTESDEVETAKADGKNVPEPKDIAPRTGHDPELAKKLAEALKPLLEKKLSDTDKGKTSDALKLIRKDHFSKAEALQKEIKDSAARDLVEWYAFTSSMDKKTYREAEGYHHSHPDWPGTERLRKLAEIKLYRDKPPTKKILAFFKDEEPQTGPGKVLFARALLAKGDKDKAQSLVRSAWRDYDLGQTTEADVIAQFKDLLKKEDFRARVDRFLFRDRRKDINPALRAAKFLSAEERKKVDARVAVIRRSRSSTNLIDKLPADAKEDPGIVFARVVWARHRKLWDLAWDVLAKAPKKIETEVPIDGWWRELRKHVLKALEDKKYKTAYEIAKRHGLLTVNYHNDATFMAGWIALRYLKKPKLAKAHFESFRDRADGPRTRGKSNYWLGRTALALGDQPAARVHFLESAKEFNTFYGQLSLQAIDSNSRKLDIPPATMPEAKVVESFVKRPSVQALVAAHLAERQDLENRFFAHLRNYFNTPGELVLLAELAKQLDNMQYCIRIGKRGMFLKMDMAHYAYPTEGLPEFEPLRKLPEKAFLYGITRQESEFNPNIISHAGARGLMQVMPGTARHVTRRYKIKYHKAKLISDPAYNVRIASAYIGDGLDQFDGNYVMTMAGFNAGPGRVRQWVKQFGDPRSSAIDPIDWIERIPFSETRNYVLKVMSNIQIYRSRLGSPDKALRVVQDLYRSRSDKPPRWLSASN